MADAQLIVVEDRDGPPELGPGLGEDLQILVVPPEAIGQVDAETLKDAQALVVTKLDQAPKGFDLAAARDRLHAASPTCPCSGWPPATTTGASRSGGSGSTGASSPAATERAAAMMGARRGFSARTRA